MTDHAADLAPRSDSHLFHGCEGALTAAPPAACPADAFAYAYNGAGFRSGFVKVSANRCAAR